MKPNEVAELLKGKMIKEIKHHSYLGWSMCVDEIIFTDGTIIEVGGNADEGRFDSIKLIGKENIPIVLNSEEN